MQEIYRVFYLDGRDDIANGDLPVEIDVDPLVEKVLGGADLYKETYEASKTALAGLNNRKKFAKDNQAEISASGGDETLAWEQYQTGRCDQLRAALENEVIEAIREHFEDDEEEEEDDEEDEEENDGDEEEEEDEEDEEDDDSEDDDDE